MPVGASQNNTELRPALIGREADLALLREKMSIAAAGIGSIVLIAGETGVGKTRLVSAAEEICAHGRMLFLRGRGTRENGNAAYGLFSEVLEGCNRHGSSQEGQKLTAIAEESGLQFREIAPSGDQGHAAALCLIRRGAAAQRPQIHAEE